MCASPLECACIVKPSIHEDVLVCVCVALTQHFHNIWRAYFVLLELNISSYSEHFNRCKFNPWPLCWHQVSWCLVWDTLWTLNQAHSLLGFFFFVLGGVKISQRRVQSPLGGSRVVHTGDFHTKWYTLPGDSSSTKPSWGNFESMFLCNGFWWIFDGFLAVGQNTFLSCCYI